MQKNSTVTLPGVVNKIIPAVSPEKGEKAQITLDSDHDLYREVRIENTLTNDVGGKVSLKLGAPVEVTITAKDGPTTIKS